eukprot:COSAG01_NODE_1815_length_9170_cov_35.104509_12_plen_66_part_01
MLQDEYNSADEQLKRMLSWNWQITAGTLIGAQQLDHVPDEAEQARYRKKGYLSIVGGLLWAARQCH